MVVRHFVFQLFFAVTLGGTALLEGTVTANLIFRAIFHALQCLGRVLHIILFKNELSEMSLCFGIPLKPNAEYNVLPVTRDACRFSFHCSLPCLVILGVLPISANSPIIFTSCSSEIFSFLVRSQIPSRLSKCDV